MANDKTNKNYGIQTVQRAVRILRAFSRENPRLTLTDLRRMTGFSVSSLQRLLYTLTAEGLLQKSEEDKRYQLGIDFIFFAQLVEENSSLISIAKPVLERLGSETKESISLSIIENNERKCIHHVESKHQLTTLTFVGQTSPLYAGASAKIFLAYFSESKLHAYLAQIEFEKITDYTITNREILFEDLAEIRRNGYAMSVGERIKGAMSISVPIFNPFSEIIAAVTIMLPSARMNEFDLEKLAVKMKEGASEITEKLKAGNTSI